MILPTMGTSPFDEEGRRLEEDYERARKVHSDIYDVLNTTALEASTQKTSFFDKIAIGSGAAIAAIVSFLGAHSIKLHPHWVLQTSLVLLALAIVSALYRNYRYPLYRYSAVSKQLWAATIDVEEHRNALFNPRLLGTPSEFKELNDKEEKREKRLWANCRLAERVCLFSVSVAMISLVVLALCNF